MRILRWVGIVLVLILVLVAATAAWIYLTFDPEDYKAQISQQVQARTGRTLNLAGPLSLSFFPWIGLSAEDVSLGNAPAGPPGDFLSARRVEVKVSAAPLLDGQIVVDTLALEGVELELVRGPDGQENWADLLALGDKGEAPSEAPAPARGESAPGWIKGYVVRGLALTDARLVWRDEQAGSSVVLDEVKLVTGSITPGTPVPMELGLRLLGADGASTGRLDAKGELALSEDFNRLQVPDLALNLIPEGVPLPVTLQGSLTLDRSAQRLQLEDLRVTGPGGIALSGTLSGDLSPSATKATGHLKLAQFDPRKVAAALGAAVPKTRDPAALTKVSGEFDLDATADKIILKPLSLVLDDTRLKGQMGVAPGGSPMLTFNLNADAIDVDRYLAPQAQATANGNADAKATTAAGAGAEVAGLGVLGAVDAQGNIAVGKVRFAGLDMTEVRLGIRSGGGKVSLAPMKAGLYGGQYQGNLHLEGAGGTVKWRAKEELASVQIGPLLKDLTGDDRIEGTGNLQAQLQGAGLSDMQIRRSLQGTATFKFTDGALKGVNLAQLVRDVKARLKGRAPERDAAPKTDFSELSGTLNFGNGKVRNNDLAMKSPYVRVSGKGEANLVTEKVDYLLTAKVVGSAKGQGGGEYAELAGVTIPVKVRGTLTDPSFQPDLDAVVKELAGERIDQEKARLQQKAKEEVAKEADKLDDKVQEELGKALKKLF